MAEEEQKIPQYLYHYGKVDEEHPEYTEAIFTKNEIFFDSPLNYNDPFDTKIHYALEGTDDEKISFLKKDYQKTHPDIPEEDIILSKPVSDITKLCINNINKKADEYIRGRVGIFCLCEEKNNILMWSHYADSHMGFCLEFLTKNDFFGNARPVNYCKKMPVYNRLKKPSSEDEETKIFLAKAEGWDYEKEWRFAKFDSGVEPFPPEALTGVIFGYKIAPENKEKIINWCRQRNPRPQLYNAVPKESEYGLDIVPFDYPA